MSSCLSPRACGFDLEHMIKWPCCNSTTTTISNTSSPSSTLSNSPIAVSAQKPRTSRKRPNQTYNEAVSLLCMASPNIFKIKHLTKRTNNLPKFIKHHTRFFNDPPELISRFSVIENPGFLLQRENNFLHKCSIRNCTSGPNWPNTPLNLTHAEASCTVFHINSCHSESMLGCISGPNWPDIDACTRLPLNSDMSLGETKSACVSSLDEFDIEAILNEETEQDIDSIMGDSKPNDTVACDSNTCYGYPMGLGFGVRALKNADERNWWNIPMVDVVSTSPAAIAKCESNKKKKKKKKSMEGLKKSESEFRRQGLVLKLDYDDVLNEWAGKGILLPEEISYSSSPGGDVHAQAANIDIFYKDGGWKASSATRPMDMNHFKKIRPVKSASSDKRPRCEVSTS